MKSFRSPFLLPLLYPKLTWRVPVTGNELFLSFDDGPVPGPTEFVLDTLRNYHAKATFFCIGANAKKNPSILESVKNAGHAIGNHTFDHLNGWKQSVDAYVSNIQKCEEVLGKSSLFRPPYGKITRRQINAVRLQIIMWDVLTWDFDTSPNKDICLKNSIKATRPGSIVVFHDSYKAESKMKFILPRFIEHFSGLGYSFGVL